MSFKDRFRFVTPKTRLRLRGLYRHGFLSLKTRGGALFPEDWPDWKRQDFIVKRRFYWRTYIVDEGCFCKWEDRIRVIPKKTKWLRLLQPNAGQRPLCPRSQRARRTAARHALRDRGRSSPPI